MKPMRMWVLLAVFWAAGSLLLAAESRVSQPAAAQGEANPAAAGAGTPAQGAAEASQGAPAADSQPAPADVKPGAQADAPTDAQADATGTEAKASQPASPRQSATAAEPATTVRQGPSPQRFVPSEQVRADFDVSFPIDI